MPIESRIPTEEMNVKHLQIEQPEGNPIGLSFDIKKEISEDTFNLMVKDTGDWKQEDADVYLHFISEMKSLYPKHELNLSNSKWEEMATILQKDREESYKGFASDAADIKVLFPEKFKQLGAGNFDLQTLRVMFSKMRADFLTSRENGPLGDYLGMARSLKIIAPDFADKLILSDKEIKNALLDPERLNKWKTESIGSFADFAASVKILYPDSTPKQLQISGKDWQAMLRDFRGLISSAKGGHTFWPRVASRAQNMQILAAHELKFTDQGIETLQTTTPNFNEKAKTLPEVKKF